MPEVIPSARVLRLFLCESRGAALSMVSLDHSEENTAAMIRSAHLGLGVGSGRLIENAQACQKLFDLAVFEDAVRTIR